MARSSAGPAGRIVVAGVGSTVRRDDGCGPRVVRALRGRLGPPVELVEQVGEPTALLDVWDGADLAIVVDASRSSAPAGSVRRLDASGLVQAIQERQTSSHGFSVRDAYEIGQAVGRLPRRLVVYLVEADELATGDRLSATVAEGVVTAADRIAAEVGELLRRPTGSD